jgi:cell division protein FtsN
VLALSRDAFVLKCDAFSSSAGANQQAEKLRTQGLNPSIVPITRDGKTLQSVQVGSYTTFAQAQSASDNLSQKGIKTLVFP